ncbi:adaptor protein MecA, partial [Enterococcus sp. S157_ASV_20]|nr:adaptor protein MecA [Enterococcus sp. S157_ASV_20]
DVYKRQMDDLSSLEGLSEVNADVSELIRKQIEADKAAADELDEMEATDETNRNVIFELDNFEAMIQLSKEVFMQSVLTNLYTYNDRYYLQVLFLTDELEKTNVDNEIAQILEFAHKTTVTQDTLVEYGTCIMERSALELTRYYFND